MSYSYSRSISRVEPPLMANRNRLPCKECGNTVGHLMSCVSGNAAAGRYQRQLAGELTADEKIALFMDDARTIADGLGFKEMRAELRQVARRLVRAGWMPPMRRIAAPQPRRRRR